MTQTITAKDPHKLRAMELRGGNDATTDWVSVFGFEAYIYAQPYQNAPVGGDFRFVTTCAMGHIVRFTLLDLAGHGQEAADAGTRLRTMIRRNMNIPNPTRFARTLNKELTRLADHGRFATAVIATYFAPTDHLIVCNAGHPRPLLLRAPAYAASPADARQWRYLDEHSPCLMDQSNSGNLGISNLPLGIISETKYPQFATSLMRGDMLVVYTDALIEATDPTGKPLGEEGLLDIVQRLDLAKSTPDQIGGEILDAISAFRGGAPANDDVTLLVLYHTATNPPDGVWSRLRALGRLVGLVR